MLEFNPDGSMKLTSGQMEQMREEEKSIVITREQLSEKPAKAQIKITFPEDLEDPQKIQDFYNKIDSSEFGEVFHEFNKVNNRIFTVAVTKGTLRMYSLLDFMVMCFKIKFEQVSDFRNQKKVILKGRWAHFS